MEWRRAVVSGQRATNGGAAPSSIRPGLYLLTHGFKRNQRRQAFNYFSHPPPGGVREKTQQRHQIRLYSLTEEADWPGRSLCSKMSLLHFDFPPFSKCCPHITLPSSVNELHHPQAAYACARVHV